MTATAYKSLERETRKLLRTDGAERYVDFGVEIRVVCKSSAGVSPDAALPPVVLSEKYESLRVGGCFDTLTRKFIGPCKHWRVWLVGEKQFEILTGQGPTQHMLLYSAEGGGKTVLMAMWIWLQIFAASAAGVGGVIGGTAPTGARLGSLTKAVCELAPISTMQSPVRGAWGLLKSDDNDLTTVSGHVIQFRSTKPASGATGSPIQGWNWGLGAAVDEAQDSVSQGAYENIVARLRSGKRAPICATATAKDSPAWRNWRDALSKNWTLHRLSYLDTPFVHDEHWAMMQLECSEREWKRRGLAMDVGPERMVYHTWDRAKNLRPIPQIGARDVTASVLRRYGQNIHALVGHDPGTLFDVSIILKAYEMKGHRGHAWFVVDEVTTEQTTTEQHAVDLLRSLREKWNCNKLDFRGRPKDGGYLSLVRADPHGQTDSRPDRSVYTIFRNAGIDIRPAVYAPARTGGSVIGASKPGRILKEARIEMVCSLLCNAMGDRRLFVAADDRGYPCAPRLVEAIELSERDAAGDAETHRKDKTDLSHWVASLGYALFDAERPRYSAAGEA